MLYEDINIFKLNLEEHIMELIEETDAEYKYDLNEVNHNITEIQEMLSKHRYAF